MATSKLQGSARYKEVVQAFEKYGFDTLIHKKSHRESISGSIQRRLRNALQESGGWFVILGRWLAYRPDLVEGTYCIELVKLKDRAIPQGLSSVKDRLHEIYARPLQTVFKSFQYKATESTTQTQTHKARLVSGEEVYVKVLRSDVQATLKEDLAIMEYFVKKLKEKKIGGATQVANIVKEFKEHATLKLDLSSEEQFLHSSAQAYGSTYVPKVYDALCNKEVIVFNYQRPKTTNKGIIQKEIDELGQELTIIRGELLLGILGLIFVGLGIFGHSLTTGILGLVGIAMLISVVVLLVQANKQ